MARDTVCSWREIIVAVLRGSEYACVGILTIAMTRNQAQLITKVLGDPTRFEIFQRIARCPEEMACADLKNDLSVTPATLSHHLKELADAGLITARREAKFMHLKVNQRTWKSYLELLHKIV